MEIKLTNGPFLLKKTAFNDHYENIYFFMLHNGFWLNT